MKRTTNEDQCLTQEKLQAVLSNQDKHARGKECPIIVSHFDNFFRKYHLSNAFLYSENDILKFNICEEE